MLVVNLRMAVVKCSYCCPSSSVAAGISRGQCLHSAGE